VLDLCSVCVLKGANIEFPVNSIARTRYRETLCFLFSIYGQIPKLNVAGSIPVSRSIPCNGLPETQTSVLRYQWISKLASSRLTPAGRISPRGLQVDNTLQRNLRQRSRPHRCVRLRSVELTPGRPVGGSPPCFGREDTTAT
jgi:hypothetical protein